MTQLSEPLKCLTCIEHGAPYDGACAACGYYTDKIGMKGRIERHDPRFPALRINGGKS